MNYTNVDPKYQIEESVMSGESREPGTIREHSVIRSFGHGLVVMAAMMMLIRTIMVVMMRLMTTMRTTSMTTTI